MKTNKKEGNYFFKFEIIRLGNEVVVLRIVMTNCLEMIIQKIMQISPILVP